MNVDDGVRDFYLGNKVPIDKMISVGVARHNLSPASVKEAAIQVYRGVQDGGNIRQIRLAWVVFSLAKQIQGDVDASVRTETDSTKKKIA